MKFYIYTLGCKVNAYESEMMKEKLLQNGYLYSKENPDIIIVNTCSVTNVADHKSLKMVRHFKHKYSPKVLLVAGCSSQNNDSFYQACGIDILIGNQEKSHVVELIENFLKNHQNYFYISRERNILFEDMSIHKFTTHTRAFVKIEDGCDNFCSYCIIPYVRGSERSKGYQSVLLEVKTLVQNGHKEIVLTGIHTGRYSDSSHDLTDLIHEMSQIEDLKRIRISSIEVTELNDKFLTELQTNPKICNHLHIPLQAGSNEILMRMNRKYDLDYFEEKVRKIREIRPDISITTDIIVGHPYETEELFLQTVSFAEKMKFSKIHVFPYSKREGTKSSIMPHQVSDIEKKRRSKELCNLSLKLERLYHSQFLHTTCEVLMEDGSIGCTSNYLKVKVLEPIDANTFCHVEITGYDDDILIGEVNV